MPRHRIIGDIVKGIDRELINKLASFRAGKGSPMWEPQTPDEALEEAEEFLVNAVNAYTAALVGLKRYADDTKNI